MTSTYRRTPRTLLVAWLPVLLWLLLVALASGSVASEANVEKAITGRSPSTTAGVAHAPDDGFALVPFVLNGLRKPAHVLVYGVLGLLLLRALRRTWPETGKTLVAVAAVSAAGLVAAVDETHQSFQAGRTGLFSDVLLDLAAGALAVYLVLRLQAKRRE
jgi:hypothetical protein